MTVEDNIALHIPASVERLEEARAFVGARAEALGVPPTLTMKLDLVLEELLVNVGSYAYPDGGGDLEICCSVELDDSDGSGSFCLRLCDWGVHFDPLAKDDPDVQADMDERTVGGLGIFLATQMADECSYTRKGNRNEFKACFSF